MISPTGTRRADAPPAAPLSRGRDPDETEPGLPQYGVMDFSLSRDFGRNFEVFFGVQNTFDQEYYVQLQPTTTGSPRLSLPFFSSARVGSPSSIR